MLMLSGAGMTEPHESTPGVRRVMSRILAAAAVAPLAGCVSPTTSAPSVSTAEQVAEQRKQFELVVENQMADSKRLFPISWRIRTAVAPDCGEMVRRELPVFLFDPGIVPGDQADAYKSVLGKGPGVHVVAVIEDGAAAARSETRASSDADDHGAASGAAAYRSPEAAPQTTAATFLPGDQFLAIGDVSIPLDRDGLSTAQKQIHRQSEADGTVSILVQRGADQVTVRATARLACDYGVAVNPDSTVNAYADGDNIVFYSGMIRQFVDDTELATVFAHELAHNVQGHIDAGEVNAASGAIVGAVLDLLVAAGGVDTGGYYTRLGGSIGAGAFSQSFEIEADYVGLYFLHKAGFDIDAAPKTWRRLALGNPDSITYASSHPTSAERFVTMEKAVEEIRRKLAAGEDIRPNLRNAQRREDIRERGEIVRRR